MKMFMLSMKKEFIICFRSTKEISSDAGKMA